MRTIAAAVGLSIVVSVSLSAQSVEGHVSVMADTFPGVDTSELRSRLFAKFERDVGTRIHLTAAGFADGLLRHRPRQDRSTAGVVEPLELSLDAHWEYADVRVGFTRVAWGRLDEFLPTDVVNPQDLTRFFLEGRSEGRMPVAMTRVRWLPSDRFSLETLYVPFFRAGKFDQLDESTAPFNPTTGLRFEQQAPARRLSNGQGGLRASATTGRIDWSISTFRGFEPLPVYTLDGVARHPRFTMIGGDVETVRGNWGIRGEVAAFVKRTLQLQTPPGIAAGQTIEAGGGVDRKAGHYRVSANVIVTSRILPVVAVDRHDVSIVGSIDRSFARETRTLRMFGVYNPQDDSAFGRVIGAWSLRDNLAIEGSIGVFSGEGANVLARFRDRDFVYARLKAFF